MSVSHETRRRYARLSCGHVALFEVSVGEPRLPRSRLCDVCHHNSRVKDDRDQAALGAEFHAQPRGV